jgi:hypothetical protein
MVPPLLLLFALGAEDFTTLEARDGVTVASRPVPGSDFLEYRLTAPLPYPVERLCGLIWASKRENVTRQVLAETADSRTTYDQVHPVLVSQRDYALVTTRSRPGAGRCRIDFQVHNELAPPLQAGWVRIERMAGSWLFTQGPEGVTQVTYVLHTEPGGGLSPFFTQGAIRAQVRDELDRLRALAAGH